MFLRLQTQWQVTQGGFVGLKYEVALPLLRMFKVKKAREVFEGLQVMEIAALPLLNKKE